MGYSVAQMIVNIIFIWVYLQVKIERYCCTRSPGYLDFMMISQKSKYQYRDHLVSY